MVHTLQTDQRKHVSKRKEKIEIKREIGHQKSL